MLHSSIDLKQVRKFPLACSYRHFRQPTSEKHTEGWEIASSQFSPTLILCYPKTKPDMGEIPSRSQASMSAGAFTSLKVCTVSSAYLILHRLHWESPEARLQTSRVNTKWWDPDPLLTMAPLGSAAATPLNPGKLEAREFIGFWGCEQPESTRFILDPQSISLCKGVKIFW